MNKIDAKMYKTSYDYEKCFWVIDNKTLPEYLSDWAKESTDERFKGFAPFDTLCPAWDKDIDYEGDVRFVWKTIDMDSAVVPLLLCPDDTDFTCIVIVVEVEKIGEYVYWNRIGYVLHEREDYEEEKRSGISCISAYTDEDWEKYGDNIAWEKVDSWEWRHWISENWAEELYRRRMNYTLPYYQTEGNICWVKTTDWVFARTEYDKMVDVYWDMQVLKQIENWKKSNSLDKESCAKFLADLTCDGRETLEQHIREYGEVLLHILAPELLGKPLIELLKHPSEQERKIQIYCNAIECMWRYGNEEAVNVVDVTLLERLSDDEKIWTAFGKNISNEFIKYINEDLLVANLMMCGVKPLDLN